jgi:two-component system phosphate regulon sensor histidine kinase PhoR
MGVVEVVTSQSREPEYDDLWHVTMEHSPVGMAIVSISGNVVTANAALGEMLGHGAEVLSRMNVRDLTHPDDLAADLRLVAQCLAGHTSSYRVTRRYVRADGSTLVADVSVALMRAPSGSPVRFVLQLLDLTDRQTFVERLGAAQAVVESQQRKADAVFGTVAVGLLLLDADGSYAGYNSRHQHFMDLAYPDGHVGRVGQTGHLYDSDQSRALTAEEMPTVRAVAGEEFDDVLIWIGADPPTRRALSVSARSIRDGSGVLTGAALAFQDVTELMRAIRAKDEFVGTVSHELRTPLTSAMAHLELIGESSEVSPRLHQQVTAVRRNVSRLSRLIADLLLATRVGAGSSFVDPYPLDAVTVVAEALDAARVEAAVADVTLEIELPDRLDARVDGLRLRQVVDNLVANAIGYTPRRGRVTVTLAAEDDHLVLTVTDDGAGIDAADLDSVFERFHRGENARLLGIPGTGLGLTIVRAIVDAHGGEVGLTSAPGRGTSVRVALPR